MKYEINTENSARTPKPPHRNEGRAFEKSSELLWDTTEGQLAFGNIYIADDATGEDTADIVPSWLRHGR